MARSGTSSEDTSLRVQVPEQQEQRDCETEFSELRASADTGVNIDIGSLLIDALNSAPGRFATAFIAARTLQNRLRSKS